MICGFFLSDYMSNFQYMVCPQNKISLTPFEGLTCTPDPMFAVTSYNYMGLSF
eukprot:CAMPEP_0202980588 /NCGR_PEP_ID=MMETSP1396-20130829/86493_1 /ASSEMBLY_ACC=CAM_ASM_000872 /TAXON_ID= /ORGANISM="Pseudokeronopsis sp., Strain Brazil" /LENGTH=52 /DNA_ID=CAMNT_0049720673 /DNA_START=699 /DNA_END=857 /DNA_ORIENTATION=+